jgi:hypothetical protein
MPLDLNDPTTQLIIGAGLIVLLAIAADRCVLFHA